ncbi:MAG: S-layer homology domain-containing protein [Acidimicrobiales bacterium]|nr:S-layer homology domain-containing protein [Acidimicrobiales bacterium]
MRAVGGVVVLIVATTAAAVVATASGAQGATVPTVAPTVTFAGSAFGDIVTDPATGRVLVSFDDSIAVFDAEGQPETVLTGLPGARGMAVDGRSLWVALATSGSLAQVDLDTLTVAEVLAAGTTVTGSVAVVGGKVWFPVGSSDRRSLMMYDPATGVFDDRGGSVYGGRVVAIPGSDTHLLFHDVGLSPFSVYRVDLTTDPIRVEGDVPHGEGSNLREVAATDHGTFVTASGSPYQFPEFSLTTMQRSGVAYTATNYPSGIDYTAAEGGYLAGATQSTNQVYVYRDGHPSPMLNFKTTTEPEYLGVELADDARHVYVVTEETSTTLGLVVQALDPSRTPKVTLAAEPVVTPGQTLHFSVGVENRSTTPLTGLVVTVPGTTCAAPPASLGVGASVTVECTYLVTTGDIGTHQVAATLSTDQGETVVSETIEIRVDPVPGPTVALSATPSAVTPGQTITYTARVRNPAALAVTGVVLDGGPLDCDDGPEALDPGATADVRCTHVAELGDVGAYAAHVRVSADDHDPAESNGVTTTVGPVPTPTVVASATEPTVVPGEVIHYGLTIRNRGALALTDLVLTTWTAQCEDPPGTILPGDTATVTCRHRARGSDLGSYGHAVTVDSAETDAVTSNVVATDVVLPPHGFSDIVGSPAYDAGVSWAKFFGVIDGYADNTFRPNRHVTRGQAVSMLWTMMDTPVERRSHGFSDVTRGSRYHRPLKWATAGGMVRRSPGTPFRPGDAVSRAQLVRMMWEMAGAPTGAPDAPYTDLPAGSAARAAIAWADHAGLVGRIAPGSTFRPRRAATRADAALLLRALAERPDAWAADARIPSTVLFPVPR